MYLFSKVDTQHILCLYINNIFIFENRYLIYVMLVLNSFFNILVSLIVIYCVYARHMRRLFPIKYLIQNNLTFD